MAAEYAPARRTRRVVVGSRTANPVMIGGGAPIAVQSMTNTSTRDAEATLTQIRDLHAAGCEIVRASVPDGESLEGFARLKEAMRSEGPDIPLVADIHFDHRLALGAIEAGADKIRFNPGNIGPRERAIEVAEAARDAGVPVRVGVNAGSLRKDHGEKFLGLESLEDEVARYALRHGPAFPLTAHESAMTEALVHSALWGAGLVTGTGHEDVVISVKSSTPAVMIAAYSSLSEKTDLPLHLGLTEAGTTVSGAVKSSAALSALLARGIGDTLRVSLADDPVVEVRVAYELLGALGLRRRGIDIVACPTCARCGIDLIGLAKAVQSDLQGIAEPMRVAVMGCVVNGPGEAREADIGVASGDGVGLIFEKGEIVAKVPEAELRETLLARVRAAAAERPSL